MSFIVARSPEVWLRKDNKISVVNSQKTFMDIGRTIR